MVKKVNPWAVCTAKVGRENKDKYERCVMGIKSKYDIKESIANAIVKSLNERRRSQDPQGGPGTAQTVKPSIRTGAPTSPVSTKTTKLPTSVGPEGPKFPGASTAKSTPKPNPSSIAKRSISNIGKAVRGGGVATAMEIIPDLMAYKGELEHQRALNLLPKERPKYDYKPTGTTGTGEDISQIDFPTGEGGRLLGRFKNKAKPSDATFKKSDVKVSDAPYRKSEPKAAASEAPKSTSKATPTNTPDQSKPPSSGTPRKDKPRKRDDDEGADCTEVRYDPDNPLFSGKSVFNKKVCKPKKSWRDDNSMKYSNEFKQIFESKITEGIFGNILKKAKGIGKAAWAGAKDVAKNIPGNIKKVGKSALAGAKDIAKDIPGDIITGTGRAWLAQTKAIPGLGYISSKVQDKAIDEPEKQKQKIKDIMKKKNDPERKANLAAKEAYRARKAAYDAARSRSAGFSRNKDDIKIIDDFERDYPSGKYESIIVNSLINRINELKVNPMIDRKEVRRMKAAGVSKKARREFTADDVARKESDKKIKASMGPNNPKNTFRAKPKLNKKYIEGGKKGKSETPMTKAQIDRSGTGGKPAAGRPGQTKADVLKKKLAKIDATSTAFMANLAKNPKNSQK